MIKINFLFFIAFALSFLISLVFLLWLSYNLKKTGRALKEEQALICCPFCSSFFYSFADKEIFVCPACKSYISHKDFDPPKEGNPHV